MNIGLPTGGAVTMLWQGGALWQKAMTFDQLIASFGDILGLADDSQSLGGRGAIPDAIDAAAIRHTTGLSQAAFARSIGVSLHTVRNWEQAADLRKDLLGSCWQSSTAIRRLSKRPWERPAS